MSEPVILDETIEVSRPLHEVFAYLADFSRIEEWDPAVAGAARLTEGPPGVGTEYRIDMKAGFALHYRVVGFEPDARIRMTVDSRFFTANEEIRFRRMGGRTRVRYIAEFDFPAPIAVVSRRFPGIMDRVGKSAMGGLKSALEDAFEPPGASPWIEAADRLVLPGLWRFTRLGYCAARRQWRPVSAYLGDKRIVITGATSGIGRAATEELARRGANLVLVARDEARAHRLVEELAERTGNGNIEYEIADLSLMADVHALCDRLLADGRPVDVLINNAGALFNPRQVTQEGLEKSFALLLLGPCILTERLHPLLQATGEARVVNVLSGGMYTQKIHVDDLQSEHGAYSGSVAYARAKRGLMILTEEWAGRWRDDGIAVNAMHPGWADTPGVEQSLPGFYRVTKSLLRTPEQGADTVVWLAAATEAGEISGEFWLDRQQHPSHLSPATRESAEERARLLQALAAFAASTRPATAPRRRRARAAAG